MTAEPGNGRSAAELRTETSGALGLLDEPQDWGIVNADADRLEEFVEYLNDHDLARTQVFDLIELILASANDRLLEGASAGLPMVQEVLDRYPEVAEAHYDYWVGLEDDAEFPLGAWLRARRSG